MMISQVVGNAFLDVNFVIRILVLNIYSTFDGGKNRLSAEWLWKLSP